MKTLQRRVSALRANPLVFAAFLLALCMAAYGPLLTKLGFYWDDFPMSWIASTMGGAGLGRYFATNRPVWGLVYRITTPLLGNRPLNWQIFALLLRWITGLALWALLRLVWSRSGPQSGSRRVFAAWAAALFVVYPGFSQQYISFVYSHFFIILIVFLSSLVLMLLALRSPRWYWPFTILSMVVGLLNLVSMEYFFLLDLLRPLILWIVLSDTIPDLRKRLGQTLLRWLPFLVVFGGAMYWRSVLFGFQTYQPALMSRVKANPLQAILQQLPIVLADIWKTSYGAWAKAFVLPDVLEIGARNLQRYWLFVIAGALVAAAYLVFYRSSRTSVSRSDQRGLARRWLAGSSWAWQPAVLGVLALLIAGGPFWLTDLQVGLVFPNDRFTLPFMLGASMVVAALLVLLPAPRWSKAILLGIGLGFAIGAQYQYAIDYNRDWSVQRAMFWQLTWRIPALQPGTALLSNELPVTHYTDNSLTAPLNWTFDPHNDPRAMKYALLYPTLRKAQLLSNFTKNAPIHLDYLATAFDGSTGQMLSFYYNPPGCMRILDPEIDILNWTVPEYLREGLALSSTRPILTQAPAAKDAPRPPARVFGVEIPHGWCYYFEKADLARQQGDWKEVVQLSEQGLATGEYPNDPLERFPLIEGYAHVGQWKQAVDLSHKAIDFSPLLMRPMVCKLWERIQRQTEDAPERAKALPAVSSELGCNITVR